MRQSHLLNSHFKGLKILPCTPWLYLKHPQPREIRKEKEDPLPHPTRSLYQTLRRAIDQNRIIHIPNASPHRHIYARNLSYPSPYPKSPGQHDHKLFQSRLEKSLPPFS